MKQFPHFLLCLALLIVGKATAQETFAPLISENCAAIVHLDLRKVNLDDVKDSLQTLGENLVENFGFDNKSLAAVKLELAIELEKLDILVRQPFNTITKDLGINEVALIFDMDFIAQGGSPPIIAIPWENKTDKQFETLRELLVKIDLRDDMFTKTDGFLLVNPSDKETADWAKNIKPAPGNAPILEALKSVAGKEIKLAVAMPEQARTFVRDAPMPPDMPAEVKTFFLFVSQKVEWASASLSLANLFGKEAAKDADVFLTVKTVKRADAALLREMLESLIDIGVKYVQFQMEQEMRGGNLIPPLAFQMAKGYLRTQLPEVAEDNLVFRAKGGVQAAVPILGVGYAWFAQPRMVPVAPRPLGMPPRLRIDVDFGGKIIWDAHALPEPVLPEPQPDPPVDVWDPW
jgi:hypothetical protein